MDIENEVRKIFNDVCSSNNNYTTYELEQIIEQVLDIEDIKDNCIKTWDENGKETMSNKEHVTSVFLSSFTFNILNINESSKSSLLEKID